MDRATAGARRSPTADLTGATDVELVVTTGPWEYCHAVWLDPVLDGADDVGDAGGIVVDPLQRAASWSRRCKKP